MFPGVYQKANNMVLIEIEMYDGSKKYLNPECVATLHLHPSDQEPVCGVMRTTGSEQDIFITLESFNKIIMLNLDNKQLTPTVQAVASRKFDPDANAPI